MNGKEAVFLQNLSGDRLDAGRLLELPCVNRHDNQAEPQQEMSSFLRSL